jgi:predicted metal-dependent HD superfamily phosphohydrolase
MENVSTVPRWDDPVAVALAVLFHDAVYEAGHSDNEARSAQLMAACVARDLPQLMASVPRAEQLIVLTARHGKLQPHEVDAEAALFLDCDMAILAAPPERYAAYEHAIASEYAAIPADLYRKGRSAFLRGLLAKERIYLSDHFHTRMNAAARINLTRAAAALDS